MNKLLQAISGLESRENDPYNALNDKEVLKYLNEYYKETQRTTPQEVEEAMNELIVELGGFGMTQKMKNAINTIRNYAFPKVSEDVEELFELIDNEVVSVHTLKYHDHICHLKQTIRALQQEVTQRDKIIKMQHNLMETNVSEDVYSVCLNCELEGKYNLLTRLGSSGKIECKRCGSDSVVPKNAIVERREE